MAKTTVFILFALSVVCFFVSCSNQEDQDAAIFTVAKKDFGNILIIDGVVEPVSSTSVSCPGYVWDGTLTYIIDDGTFVKQGDTLCIIEFLDLQTRYDESLVGFENASANIETIKATLALQYAQLQAQVLNNEADTKIAEMDSLQLLYSTPNQRKIQELELQKVTIEKNRYEKKLKATEIINQSEIRALDLRIQQYASHINTMKEQLDGLVMKSPGDGLVITGTSWQTGKKLMAGDNVWSNVPIITLPEMSKMKIKIMAPEADYKTIEVGDSVNFTFDAMPDNLASGRITHKSPVGQPVSRDSKVKYFEIEASVDSVLTMPEPGLTAKCNIVRKEIRDTIVVPQIAVFDRDSMKVVFVKRRAAKGYEKRQVMTGLSSPKEVIIAAGLSAGDEISLSMPEEKYIRAELLLPDSIRRLMAPDTPQAVSPADSLAAHRPPEMRLHTELYDFDSNR